MTGAAKNRAYLGAIGVLLLIIGLMTYKFVVVGSTLKAEDGRIVVLLEPGERDLMLKEMRAFVESLQLMSDALAKDDMIGVSKAARAMGMSKSQDVPLAMVGKLPLEFKKLAFSVHGAFDTIADDAETVGTAKHTLGQLSSVLQKCVACHSSYQLKVPATK